MSDPVPKVDAVHDGPVRKIIHIDMDAFFASVEQRDDPALRGRPVAVGGSRERGVVAAASYEARRFGVRSAMPSVTARRLCPDLVFAKPRFDAYKAVSRQIRAIFAAFTPVIEPLSLDEAYLDVTDRVGPAGSATRVAQAIRARIAAETGLTASAGVSYNKFLAKLASDHRKPDGLTVIAPRQGPGFVEALPIARFHGVGPKTADKMRRLGIATGFDLRAQTAAFLEGRFGKSGRYYYLAARAIDHRAVTPDRVRKSVGSETTFARDAADEAAVMAAIAAPAGSVWAHCAAVNVTGRTVTLKVKYADFKLVTRSRTCVAPVMDARHLEEVGRDLVAGLFPLRGAVRLLGLSMSNLGPAGSPSVAQLPLGL